MYSQHFDLIQEPFKITPDPRFLYMSQSHKEAYATIIYGIENRKGLMSITGEVGTGKTTIVNYFLEKNINPHIKPIHVVYSHISFDELIRIILENLNHHDRQEKVSVALIDQLNQHLIEELKNGYIPVLLIDEAQNMPDETLHQLRVLYNMESDNQKLIQIILVGQPELNEKLSQPQLRNVEQCIAMRVQINPLNMSESSEYINHRVTICQLKPGRYFPDMPSDCWSKHHRASPSD